MKNKKLIMVISAVCLLAVLGIGAMLFLQANLWTGSDFVSRNARTLDLRGSELTLEDYRNLHQQLPDCEITWDVPFQGKRFASNAQVLTVSTLSQSDLEMLSYFPKLTLLDASGCEDLTNVQAFIAARPDCQVIYQVNIGGVDYSWDVSAVQVANAQAAELMEKLPMLPNVQRVELTQTLPDIDDLEQLRSNFPDISFLWNVEIEGQTLENTATQLDLSGTTLSAEQVSQVLRWLPQLESVNLDDSALSNEELVELILANPSCRFQCSIEIGGTAYSSSVEEIDISGYQVSDPSEIERLLPCFPNLKKIIMSNCGLNNEEMDALNNRHENIRFVWTVYVQGYPLRTDADYFYPYKMSPTLMVKDEDMEVLRYCPDILCVDVGHMWYLTHCEWVQYMPKLKYLILGETRVSDLTPLSGCKNLVYLEIFTIPVTDYSPLLGCTALEDLCLGRTYGDPAPIAQMTWLKNVWWANVHGTVGTPASNAKAVLEAALPNTVLRFDIAHPTAGGWRQLQNYFDHRDLMGMHYLQ